MTVSQKVITICESRTSESKVICVYVCSYNNNWSDIKDSFGKLSTSHVEKNSNYSNISFEEFADLVSQQILLPVQLIFMGDFNIH